MLPDAEAVAARAAALIAERARAAVTGRGAFSVALSGGRTPARMVELLAFADVPWDLVTVYQVDERVAPPGHHDRNLTMLERSLAPARIVPMRVGERDLRAEVLAYDALLPDHLDLVHLGLGADGHTASLVPGDAVLEVADCGVAVTGEYQGRRRMTLTYPALDRAREAVWVITGGDKADALAKLLSGDRTAPASRVRTPLQIVLADEAAAPTRLYS